MALRVPLENFTTDSIELSQSAIGSHSKVSIRRRDLEFFSDAFGFLGLFEGAQQSHSGLMTPPHPKGHTQKWNRFGTPFSGTDSTTLNLRFLTPTLLTFLVKLVRISGFSSLSFPSDRSMFSTFHAREC